VGPRWSRRVRCAEYNQSYALPRVVTPSKTPVPGTVAFRAVHKPVPGGPCLTLAVGREECHSHLSTPNRPGDSEVHVCPTPLAHTWHTRVPRRPEPGPLFLGRKAQATEPTRGAPGKEQDSQWQHEEERAVSAHRLARRTPGQRRQASSSRGATPRSTRAPRSLRPSVARSRRPARPASGRPCTYRAFQSPTRTRIFQSWTQTNS